MNTLEDIKQAITTLTPADRVELERLLRESVAPPPSATGVPDQSARRRVILGNKVLPNMVMEARDEAAS